jgi:CubicO group peptidase (beta-lactamase class C family)
MHQPGECWLPGVADDVLAVLVARVADQRFETFLRERVLHPLGMRDTGLHVPPDKLDRFPPLYSPDPDTGEFTVADEPSPGRFSRPPAFPSGGGGLVSTVDDYHAYFRMLLGHGMQILSRPAVELMTTNRLTPAQQVTHLPHGLGRQGGWGFGMAVRTHRDDFAPIGQFGWDGETGTSAYADPANQLVGILLTQTGMSTPDSARAIHDFWTTLYQAIDG